MERKQRWSVPYADEVTGAEMSRDLAGELLGGPLRPLAEDQRHFPASHSLTGIICYDTRVRTYSEGEVIIREGDYGDSAFYILEGAVHVLSENLPSEALGRRARREKPRILRAIAQMFRRRSPYPESRRQEVRPGVSQGQRQVIPLQDFPEILLEESRSHSTDSAVHTLSKGKDHSGELFGEIAALSRTPRTATVLAAREGTRLLEIRWQGLRDIRKYSANWKEMIDER